MSNLIIMPGDVPEMQPSSLVGRTVALDFTKQSRFQTFKFYLGKARPFAQVPPDADLGDIANAVLKGILLDVTDQHVAGADLGDGNHMDPVVMSDAPGKHTVFIGSERHDGAVSACKQLFIAIPADDAQERAFMNEVKEKGRIDGVYEPAVADAVFGPISVMEIEDRPPIKNQDSSGKLFKKAFARLWWDICYSFSQARKRASKRNFFTRWF